MTSIAYERHLQRIIANGRAADQWSPRFALRYVVTVSEIRDEWKAVAFPTLWHGHVKITRFHVGSFRSPTLRDAVKNTFFSIMDRMRARLSITSPPKEGQAA